MSRMVPEWIGATDDTPVPPRVRLRVFERYEGRCYLTGRKIRPGDAWQCDHIIAIINGGANREGNLAPLLTDRHREKTAEDLAIKSKTARTRAKHLGIWKTNGPKIKSRGFPKVRVIMDESGMSAGAGVYTVEDGE